MCFSALASFVASALLAAIGLISLKVVPHKKWIAFALIPFFFSLQQACEGKVWLYGSSSAAAAFLFFAFILWPFYIPFSCLMVESDNAARSLLYALTSMGFVVALCLLFGLLSSQITFSLHKCHIVYDAAGILLHHNLLRLLIAGAYCVVTLVPFFVCTQRCMKIMGLLIASSCLVAYLFYTLYFVSVWCFFAALISAGVIVVIRKNS